MPCPSAPCCPAPPEYVVVKNACHYSFLAPFPEPQKEQFGKLAQDPAGFDREAFHRQMNREIVLFIEATLGR